MRLSWMCMTHALHSIGKTPNGFSLKLTSLRSSRAFLAFQPKNQTRIYSRFSFSSFSAFVCLFCFALCCSQSPFHSPYVYQCVHVFAELAEHYCVRVKKRKMRFFISRNNIHILQWIWVCVCVCKQVFKQLANNIQLSSTQKTNIHSFIHSFKKTIVLKHTHLVATFPFVCTRALSARVVFLPFAVRLHHNVVLLHAAFLYIWSALDATRFQLTNQPPDNHFYRLHAFFEFLHAFYSCFFCIMIIINVQTVAVEKPCST